MPAAMFVLYLLLCLPLRVRAVLLAGEGGGFLRVEAGVSGIALCLEQRCVSSGEALSLMLDRRQRGKKEFIGGRFAQLLRRAARIETISVFLRIGTGQALSTALLCGAAGAACRAALGMLGQRARIVVQPDYGQEGVSLRACCIFSVTIGDIMLAAVRLAIEKRGKEGSKWSSIPSRT